MGREEDVSSQASEARRALAAMVGGEDAAIDLFRAAFLVAAEEYPALDLGPYEHQVEEFARTLRSRLAGDLPPARQVTALNRLLFDEQGFHGNVADYYDPRNSYLNEVFDRRTGLPLTLALVYVEVGTRAGLPLQGVGFPSHFLVSYETAESAERLFLDPFNGGRTLGRPDLGALLREAQGPDAVLLSWHLEVTSPRHILARLIGNLKVAYLRRGDLTRALRASEQLSVVLPTAQELRDRGLIRFRAGDLRGATTDLQRYLEFEPSAPESATIRQQLQLIESLWARRN